MDRLTSAQNLARCRRLLDPALDPAERRRILEQLSAEAELLRQDFRIGRLPYEYGAALGPAREERVA